MNITEDQEITLNFLSKYSQLFYNFSDYHNYKKWLEDEMKLDKTIDAVRSGEYKDDITIEKYINNCIRTVKEIENTGNKQP